MTFSVAHSPTPHQKKKSGIQHGFKQSLIILKWCLFIRKEGVTKPSEWVETKRKRWWRFKGFHLHCTPQGTWWDPAFPEGTGYCHRILWQGQRKVGVAKTLQDFLTSLSPPWPRRAKTQSFLEKTCAREAVPNGQTCDFSLQVRNIRPWYSRVVRLQEWKALETIWTFISCEFFTDSSDMLVKSAPQFWGRLCSLCNSRMGQKLGAVTSFQIKCLEIIFFKWCQGEIWWLINSLSTHSLNVYYEPDTSVSLRERISCRHGTHIRWWRTTRCREGDTINKKDK